MPWCPGASPVVSVASADAVVVGNPAEIAGSDSQTGCHGAGVAAVGVEGEAPESVSDQDDGVRDRRQAQPTGPPRQCVEAIRQDIGKAEPVGFGRR